MRYLIARKWRLFAAGVLCGLVSATNGAHAFGAAGRVVLSIPAMLAMPAILALPVKPEIRVGPMAEEAPPLTADAANSPIVGLVHRRDDYHCHRKRGYRHWCHQGDRDWRDGPQRYNEDRRRYRGRPYYPRETYRRRSWPRRDYRRRYDRDRPDWRRWPDDKRPSVYQAI